MDIDILRMKLIRCFTALRHMAFETEESYIYTDWGGCEENTTFNLQQSKFLNMLEAAGFVISHRISRFFLCWTRGPPSLDCNSKSCEIMEVAMWQKNNGETEAEKLQNRFTAYLLLAVRRQQRDYILKKNQQKKHELLAENDSWQLEEASEPDMLGELPLFMQLGSDALKSALQQLSERERYVLLVRVIDDVSFEELAVRLGLGYKGVAAVYYRAVSKIKKKLKEAGRNEF